MKIFWSLILELSLKLQNIGKIGSLLIKKKIFLYFKFLIVMLLKYYPRLVHFFLYKLPILLDLIFFIIKNRFITNLYWRLYRISIFLEKKITITLKFYFQKFPFLLDLLFFIKKNTIIGFFLSHYIKVSDFLFKKIQKVLKFFNRRFLFLISITLKVLSYIHFFYKFLTLTLNKIFSFFIYLLFKTLFSLKKSYYFFFYKIPNYIRYTVHYIFVQFKIMVMCITIAILKCILIFYLIVNFFFLILFSTFGFIRTTFFYFYIPYLIFSIKSIIIFLKTNILKSFFCTILYFSKPLSITFRVGSLLLSIIKGFLLLFWSDLLTLIVFLRNFFLYNFIEIFSRSLIIISILLNIFNYKLIMGVSKTFFDYNGFDFFFYKLNQYYFFTPILLSILVLFILLEVSSLYTSLSSQKMILYSSLYLLLFCILILFWIFPDYSIFYIIFFKSNIYFVLLMWCYRALREESRFGQQISINPFLNSESIFLFKSPKMFSLLYRIRERFHDPLTESIFIFFFIFFISIICTDLRSNLYLNFDFFKDQYSIIFIILFLIVRQSSYSYFFWMSCFILFLLFEVLSVIILWNSSFNYFLNLSDYSFNETSVFYSTGLLTTVNGLISTAFSLNYESWYFGEQFSFLLENFSDIDKYQIVNLTHTPFSSSGDMFIQPLLLNSYDDHNWTINTTIEEDYFKSISSSAKISNTIFSNVENYWLLSRNSYIKFGEFLEYDLYYGWSHRSLIDTDEYFDPSPYAYTNIVGDGFMRLLLTDILSIFSGPVEFDQDNSLNINEWGSNYSIGKSTNRIRGGFGGSETENYSNLLTEQKSRESGEIYHEWFPGLYVLTGSIDVKQPLFFIRLFILFVIPVLLFSFFFAVYGKESIYFEETFGEMDVTNNNFFFFGNEQVENYTTFFWSNVSNSNFEWPSDQGILDPIAYEPTSDMFSSFFRNVNTGLFNTTILDSFYYVPILKVGEGVNNESAYKNFLMPILFPTAFDSQVGYQLNTEKREDLFSESENELDVNNINPIHSKYESLFDPDILMHNNKLTTSSTNAALASYEVNLEYSNLFESLINELETPEVESAKGLEYEFNSEVSDDSTAEEYADPDGNYPESGLFENDTVIDDPVSEYYTEWSDLNSELESARSQFYATDCDYYDLSRDNNNKNFIDRFDIWEEDFSPDTNLPSNFNSFKQSSFQKLKSSLRWVIIKKSLLTKVSKINKKLIDLDDYLTFTKNSLHTVKHYKSNLLSKVVRKFITSSNFRKWNCKVPTTVSYSSFFYIKNLSLIGGNVRPSKRYFIKKIFAKPNVRYSYFAFSFLSNFFFKVGFNLNFFKKKMPLKISRYNNLKLLSHSTKILCLSKKFLFFKPVINCSQVFMFNTFFIVSLPFKPSFVKTRKHLILSHYLNIKIRKLNIYINYNYNLNLFFQKYKHLKTLFFNKDNLKLSLTPPAFLHKKYLLKHSYYKKLHDTPYNPYLLNFIYIFKKPHYVKKLFFKKYLLNSRTANLNNFPYNVLSISEDKIFNLFLKSIINILNLCYSLKNFMIIKNSVKLKVGCNIKKNKLFFDKKRFIQKSYNFSSPIVSKNQYNKRTNYFSRRWGITQTYSINFYAYYLKKFKLKLLKLKNSSYRFSKTLKIVLLSLFDSNSLTDWLVYSLKFSKKEISVLKKLNNKYTYRLTSLIIPIGGFLPYSKFDYSFYHKVTSNYFYSFLDYVYDYDRLAPIRFSSTVNIGTYDCRLWRNLNGFNNPRTFIFPEILNFSSKLDFNFLFSFLKNFTYIKSKEVISLPWQYKDFMKKWGKFFFLVLDTEYDLIKKISLNKLRVAWNKSVCKYSKVSSTYINFYTTSLSSLLESIFIEKNKHKGKIHLILKDFVDCENYNWNILWYKNVVLSSFPSHFNRISYCKNNKTLFDFDLQSSIFSQKYLIQQTLIKIFSLWLYISKFSYLSKMYRKNIYWYSTSKSNKREKVLFFSAVANQSFFIELKEFNNSVDININLNPNWENTVWQWEDWYNSKNSVLKKTNKPNFYLEDIGNFNYNPFFNQTSKSHINYIFPKKNVIGQYSESGVEFSYDISYYKFFFLDKILQFLRKGFFSYNKIKKFNFDPTTYLLRYWKYFEKFNKSKIYLYSNILNHSNSVVILNSIFMYNIFNENFLKLLYSNPKIKRFVVNAFNYNYSIFTNISSNKSINFIEWYVISSFKKKKTSLYENFFLLNWFLNFRLTDFIKKPYEHLSVVGILNLTGRDCIKDFHNIKINKTPFNSYIIPFLGLSESSISKIYNYDRTRDFILNFINMLILCNNKNFFSTNIYNNINNIKTSWVVKKHFIQNNKNMIISYSKNTYRRLMPFISNDLIIFTDKRQPITNEDVIYFREFTSILFKSFFKYILLSKNNFNKYFLNSIKHILRFLKIKTLGRFFWWKKKELKYIPYFSKPYISKKPTLSYNINKKIKNKTDDLNTNHIYTSLSKPFTKTNFFENGDNIREVDRLESWSDSSAESDWESGEAAEIPEGVIDDGIGFLKEYFKANAFDQTEFQEYDQIIEIEDWDSANLIVNTPYRKVNNYYEYDDEVPNRLLFENKDNNYPLKSGNEYCESDSEIEDEDIIFSQPNMVEKVTKTPFNTFKDLRVLFHTIPIFLEGGWSGSDSGQTIFEAGNLLRSSYRKTYNPIFSINTISLNNGLRFNNKKNLFLDHNFYSFLLKNISPYLSDHDIKFYDDKIVDGDGFFLSWLEFTRHLFISRWRIKTEYSTSFKNNKYSFRFISPFIHDFYYFKYIIFSKYVKKNIPDLFLNKNFPKEYRSQSKANIIKKCKKLSFFILLKLLKSKQVNSVKNNNCISSCVFIKKSLFTRTSSPLTPISIQGTVIPKESFYTNKISLMSRLTFGINKKKTSSVISFLKPFRNLNVTSSHGYYYFDYDSEKPWRDFIYLKHYGDLDSIESDSYQNSPNDELDEVEFEVDGFNYCDGNVGDSAINEYREFSRKDSILKYTRNWFFSNFFHDSWFYKSLYSGSWILYSDFDPDTRVSTERALKHGSKYRLNFNTELWWTRNELPDYNFRRIDGMEHEDLGFLDSDSELFHLHKGLTDVVFKNEDYDNFNCDLPTFEKNTIDPEDAALNEDGTFPEDDLNLYFDNFSSVIDKVVNSNQISNLFIESSELIRNYINIKYLGFGSHFENLTQTYSHLSYPIDIGDVIDTLSIKDIHPINYSIENQYADLIDSKIDEYILYTSILNKPIENIFFKYGVNKSDCNNKKDLNWLGLELLLNSSYDMNENISYLGFDLLLHKYASHYWKIIIEHDSNFSDIYSPSFPQMSDFVNNTFDYLPVWNYDPSLWENYGLDYTRSPITYNHNSKLMIDSYSPSNDASFKWLAQKDLTNPGISIDSLGFGGSHIVSGLAPHLPYDLMYATDNDSDVDLVAETFFLNLGEEQLTASDNSSDNSRTSRTETDEFPKYGVPYNNEDNENDSVSESFISKINNNSMSIGINTNRISKSKIFKDRFWLNLHSSYLNNAERYYSGSNHKSNPLKDDSSTNYKYTIIKSSALENYEPNPSISKKLSLKNNLYTKYLFNSQIKEDKSNSDNNLGSSLKDKISPFYYTMGRIPNIKDKTIIHSTPIDSFSIEKVSIHQNNGDVNFYNHFKNPNPNSFSKISSRFEIKELTSNNYHNFKKLSSCVNKFSLIENLVFLDNKQWSSDIVVYNDLRGWGFKRVIKKKKINDYLRLGFSTIPLYSKEFIPPEDRILEENLPQENIENFYFHKYNGREFFRNVRFFKEKYIKHLYIKERENRANYLKKIYIEKVKLQKRFSKDEKGILAEDYKKYESEIEQVWKDKQISLDILYSTWKNFEYPWIRKNRFYKQSKPWKRRAHKKKYSICRKSILIMIKRVSDRAASRIWSIQNKYKKKKMKKLNPLKKKYKKKLYKKYSTVQRNNDYAKRLFVIKQIPVSKQKKLDPYTQNIKKKVLKELSNFFLFKYKRKTKYTRSGIIPYVKKPISRLYLNKKKLIAVGQSWSTYENIPFERSVTNKQISLINYKTIDVNENPPIVQKIKKPKNSISNLFLNKKNIKKGYKDLLEYKNTSFVIKEIVDHFSVVFFSYINNWQFSFFPPQSSSVVNYFDYKNNLNAKNIKGGSFFISFKNFQINHLFFLKNLTPSTDNMFNSNKSSIFITSTGVARNKYSNLNSNDNCILFNTFIFIFKKILFFDKNKKRSLSGFFSGTLSKSEYIMYFKFKRTGYKLKSEPVYDNLPFIWDKNSDLWGSSSPLPNIPKNINFTNQKISILSNIDLIFRERKWVSEYPTYGLKEGYHWRFSQVRKYTFKGDVDINLELFSESILRSKQPSIFRNVNIYSLQFFVPQVKNTLLYNLKNYKIPFIYCIIPFKKFFKKSFFKKPRNLFFNRLLPILKIDILQLKVISTVNDVFFFKKNKLFFYKTSHKIPLTVNSLEKGKVKKQKIGILAPLKVITYLNRSKPNKLTYSFGKWKQLKKSYNENPVEFLSISDTPTANITVEDLTDRNRNLLTRTFSSSETRLDLYTNPSVYSDFESLAFTEYEPSTSAVSSTSSDSEISEILFNFKEIKNNKKEDYHKIPTQLRFQLGFKKGDIDDSSNWSSATEFDAEQYMNSKTTNSRFFMDDDDRVKRNSKIFDNPDLMSNHTEEMWEVTSQDHVDKISDPSDHEDTSDELEFQFSDNYDGVDVSYDVKDEGGVGYELFSYIDWGFETDEDDLNTDERFGTGGSYTADLQRDPSTESVYIDFIENEYAREMRDIPEEVLDWTVSDFYSEVFYNHEITDIPLSTNESELYSVYSNNSISDFHIDDDGSGGEFEDSTLFISDDPSTSYSEFESSTMSTPVIDLFNENELIDQYEFNVGALAHPDVDVFNIPRFSILAPLSSTKQAFSTVNSDFKEQSSLSLNDWDDSAKTELEDTTRLTNTFFKQSKYVNSFKIDSILQYYLYVINFRTDNYRLGDNQMSYNNNSFILPTSFSYILFKKTKYLLYYRSLMIDLNLQKYMF